MRRLSPKKKAGAPASKEAANSPSTPKKNSKSPPKKRAQADRNNDEGSEKEEATFEVDSIVAHRIIRGQQQFKVHWKGYPSSNDTWEFESNLNCDSLLKKYLAEQEGQEESQESNAKKNGQAKRKRGRPGKKSKSDNNGQADSEGEDDEKDVKEEKDAEEDEEEEDEEAEASTSNNAASPKRGRKKAKSEDSEASPSSPEKKKKKKVDDEEEYEVEKIMDSVMDQGKRFFLVRWKGYGKDSDTWEPQSHLSSSKDLVDEYLISHPIDDEREDGKKTRVNPRKASSYAVGPTGKRQSRRAHGRVRATYFDQE